VLSILFEVDVKSVYYTQKEDERKQEKKQESGRSVTLTNEAVTLEHGFFLMRNRQKGWRHEDTKNKISQWICNNKKQETKLKNKERM